MLFFVFYSIYSNQFGYMTALDLLSVSLISIPKYEIKPQMLIDTCSITKPFIIGKPVIMGYKYKIYI